MRARWFALAAGAAWLLAVAAPGPQGGVDLYIHDVYVVLGTGPPLAALAGLLAGLASLYRWVGHRIVRTAALAHFWLTILGAAAMAVGGWRPKQVLLGGAVAFFGGALILAGAQIVLLVALGWAVVRGTRAGLKPGAG